MTTQLPYNAFLIYLFYALIDVTDTLHQFIDRKIFLLCMEGNDLWLVVVLMHYFAIVDVHCPNRAMQRF